MVCIGWVFFRATSLSQALSVLKDLSTHGLPAVRGSLIEPALLALLLISLLAAIMQERTGFLDNLRLRHTLVVCLVTGGLLFIGEIFAAGNSLPFVYFQF
jgi:hypothetical protein